MQQLALDCSDELGNEPFWNVHRADIPRPLFIVTGQAADFRALSLFAN